MTSHLIAGSSHGALGWVPAQQTHAGQHTIPRSCIIRKQCHLYLTKRMRLLCHYHHYALASAKSTGSANRVAALWEAEAGHHPSSLEHSALVDGAVHWLP